MCNFQKLFFFLALSRKSGKMSFNFWLVSTCQKLDKFCFCSYSSRKLHDSKVNCCGVVFNFFFVSLSHFLVIVINTYKNCFRRKRNWIVNPKLIFFRMWYDFYEKNINLIVCLKKSLTFFVDYLVYTAKKIRLYFICCLFFFDFLKNGTFFLICTFLFWK